MPLYPRASDPTLKPDLFARPGAEYRGTPFWSWNCKLDADQLRRQIDQMKEMGLGGFHMHARTGLATDYMGPDFLAAVKACVEKARAEGMLAWLYDEDRWPSGFAGGLVTRDVAHRLRYLRITPRPYGPDDKPHPDLKRGLSHRDGQGVLLACYAVRLAKDGTLASARRLCGRQKSAGTVWYAYLETSPESSWHNHQTYVDTMSEAAIARFIETTHEAYHQEVGKDFGGVVPAIFTDEPQIHPTVQLPTPQAQRDVILPWTVDLAETYAKTWGEDLLDRLPELVWDLPADASARTRWRFRDHVTERFAAAFSDQVGTWCQRHGLASTGHLMSEESLGSQMSWVGECMRHYRSFQLPGIDLLCDHMELTTAKQTASVARQDGREGVLSEMYGVTNWDFPFAGHKRQGDWQAAMGITVRCHHLTWVSMAGNAKRDYPASIGYQSPWYREYPLVEDHFARVNTALVRGAPRARVAVVHPIESRWLGAGPDSANAAANQTLEQAFQDCTKWLLFGQLDFDFVAESLLPRQAKVRQGKTFTVGRMAYDAVVVPYLRTIRASTLDRLESFAAAGGRVIFLGRVPDLVDAAPSTRCARLAKRCQVLPLARADLLAALEDLREVQVTGLDGRRVEDVLYQLRVDGPRRLLFCCCTRGNSSVGTPWESSQQESLVRVRGRWAVRLLDTQAGTMGALPHRHVDGWTEVAWRRGHAASILIELSPAKAEKKALLPAAPRWREIGEVAGPESVTLAEPNVLLLDQADYRLDDGAWQPAEEIQRAENRLREMVGWPRKTGQVAQPWCEPPATAPRRAGLRFTIDTEVTVTAPRLALEDAGRSALRLDGRAVPVPVEGWWVDECIATVRLPDLAPGRHVLEVEQPFTPEGSLEWMYLLGDFGVRVAGRGARLVAPVRTLAWGDWVHQGLPFYAGNLTYRCRITAPGGRLALTAPWFKTPLLTVVLDGRRVGAIAYDPWRLDLGEVAAGDHDLEITAYGNRINAFGAVHNALPNWTWWGPNSWEMTGPGWTSEYRLWPMGLTSAPRLEVPG